AVNALSLSPDGLFVISASGDRSVRIWDTVTGKIVASLEGWHSRGIASIDFHPPYIVSGSSDKHIRVFNLQTREGWSTCCDSTHTMRPELPDNLPASLTSGPDFDPPAAPPHAPLPLAASSQVCQSCNGLGTVAKPRVGHKDLVRTVAMNHDFVVSGSYDETIKVWDRRTGALLGDLTGGHTGRVFGVVFDSTKKGGKRFEIACYKNKVQEWRNGVETDLDEVLQINNVFSNVSKGQASNSEELQKAFGKTDVSEIVKEATHSTLPIQRARMRVRITMPAKDGKRLKEQIIQGADKIEDEDWGEEWEIIMLIDPGQFRVLTELIQSDKELKGSGRIETLSFSATA
ncbi:hypothetical protein FRC11_009118, partial [Ceratobasidium sp. 423]